jgi:hypothetical protein
MLHEADLDLWVGSDEHCKLPDPEGATPGDWKAILHAAKTCHQAVLGYRGSLDPADPRYLWVEVGPHLVMNLVDAPLPLFQVESFVKALEFLRKWHPQGPVLCHCNQGLSRSPTIALLYLAKVQRVLSDATYDDARAEFHKQYLGPYAPGAGLVTFLRAKWREIG